MSVHIDLWNVTAYDHAGRPLLVARRVFTRHTADKLADGWAGRGDVSRVELSPDQPAPHRGVAAR